MAGKSLTAEVREDVSRLLAIADPAGPGGKWDAGFILRVALRIRLDADYRLAARLISRLMAFDRFEYSDLTDDPEDRSPDECFAAWLAAAELIATAELADVEEDEEDEDEDENSVAPPFGETYIAFRCALPVEPAEDVLGMSTLVASSSEAEPEVLIPLREDGEIHVKLQTEPGSPPAILCHTNSPAVARTDLRLEVSMAGDDAPIWSSSVQLSSGDGGDQGYSGRVELEATVPRGQQIEVRLHAGENARSRASISKESRIDRIARAYREGRWLEALGLAWSAAEPRFSLALLLNEQVELNALVLNACREIVRLKIGEEAAVGSDAAERTAVATLFEAFRRSDAPAAPPLLTTRENDRPEVIAFRSGVLAAVIQLALRVHEVGAEDPDGLPMMLRYFKSAHLDRRLMEDLVALWTGDGPRPSLAARELYLTLIERGETGKAGLVARLRVEAVEGGGGEFHPHPDMTTTFRDGDFRKAEANARQAVLHQLRSVAGSGPGVDLRWSIRFKEGGFATFPIAGESAGLALALGALTAMADGIAALAGARGEAVPAEIQAIRELDLDRVAASAAITADGNIEKVGHMWEKTGAALVDRISRDHVHALAVSERQTDVGENVETKAIRASHLGEMIEKLAESNPRFWARRAFAKRTETLSSPDSIAGAVDWSNYQSPHLHRIPINDQEATRMAEEAERMGVSIIPPAPISEVWATLSAGSSPPRMIVCGPSGVGKSTLLRRLGRDVMAGGTVGGIRLVPALIRLNEWLRRPPGVKPLPLADELARRSALSGEPRVVAADWERWLQQGEVLLLLDGFDEIADAPGLAERLRNDLLGLYSRCPAVLTCWSRHEGSLLGLGWPLFGMHWLTLEQIESFLNDFPFRSRGASELLKALIARSPEVRNLTSNPLYLTLLAAAAEAGHSPGEIPRNEWELFHRVVDKLIRRTDRHIRAVYPAGLEPTDAQKLGFLGQIAVWLMARTEPTYTCEEDELGDFLYNRAREFDFAYPRELANALMRDLVDRGLVRREGRVYWFPHPALQHYLCANWIVHRVRQSPDRWEAPPLAGTGHATIRQLVRDHIRMSKDEDNSPATPTGQTEGWKTVRDHLSTNIEADQGLLHEVLSTVRQPGPGEIRVADLILPAEGWGAFTPFQVGRIVVPTVRLVGGDGRMRYNYPDGVVVEDHADRRMLIDDLPDDIRTGARERIRIEREKAHARHAIYENRPMIRLDAYTHGMREEDDAPWPLILTTSRTDFETMRLTNNATHYRLPDGRTIRDKYAAEPDALSRSRLANPIATNLSVVTKDNFILVARRGNRVATNPGGWAPAVSGTGTPDHDCDPDGRYNPFRTAAREAMEEVTHPYQPRFEDITFFGMARTMHFMHPFLFGELRVPLRAEDLVSMTPGDNWEVGSLTPIAFTVEVVTEWILRWYQKLMSGDIPGGGIYSAIFSLLQSLHYQYPDRWMEVVQRLGGSGAPGGRSPLN